MFCFHKGKGLVWGAGYADLNARLPSYWIMAFVSSVLQFGCGARVLENRVFDSDSLVYLFYLAWSLCMDLVRSHSKFYGGSE